MICVAVVVGLGSFVCSWDVDSISVAARVDRAMFSLGWGRDLSPLCSFACTAIALSIWSCFCPVDVVLVSSILVQSPPPSHRGARCIKSLSTYRRGWHWVRGCLE